MSCWLRKWRRSRYRGRLNLNDVYGILRKEQRENLGRVNIHIRMPVESSTALGIDTISAISGIRGIDEFGERRRACDTGANNFISAGQLRPSESHQRSAFDSVLEKDTAPRTAKTAKTARTARAARAPRRTTPARTGASTRFRD